MAAQDYSGIYEAAGQRFNVDPLLLQAMGQHESGNQTTDPRTGQTITSPAGAKGVMQFMPQTARTYGVDVNDPVSSIFGAAHYMSDLLNTYKNVDVALAHYSGGSQGYSQQVAATYKAMAPQGASPARAPQGAQVSQATPPAQSAQGALSALPPDEQALLAGKPIPPAAQGQPAAASAPTDLSSLPPDEQRLLFPSAPAGAAAPGAAPLPPAPGPGLPASDPNSFLSAQFSGGVGADAPSIQAIGPSVPGATFANQVAGVGPGVLHGLRQAVNPLLETGSAAGNWLAAKTGLPLQTNRLANDVAAEQAFQRQYGGTDPTSQAAQGAAMVTRLGAPFALGGAASMALRGGAALAGAPEVGAFLTGQGYENAPGVLGWLGRRASNVASGAIQGGIAGGPGGAGAGAVLGSTVAPAVGAAVDWVAQRFGNAVTPAVRKIYQAVVRDGMTPQQIDQAVSQLGPLGTVADVGGTNTRQLAEGVANAGGPDAQVAVDYLTRRGEGQTQRLDDAVRTATGATGSAFDKMSELTDARSAAAAPAYANAFANTTVTPQQAGQLDRFINNPIGQRALQNGIANARLQSIEDGTPFNVADLGVTENPDGTYSLVPGTPNLRLYDAVKRGYDVLAEDFRDPTSGRLNLSGTTSVPGMGGQIQGSRLQGVRQAYTQQLRQMFPDYAKALDAWAGPSADMDALSMGRRVLTTDPDVTANTVANLSPSQQQMYQVGAAQALKDKIAATPDDADATRRIFGNDLIRSKIAAGFGGESSPAFQNFQNTMEREATFAQTNRQMLAGSPTARRTAAIQAAGQPAPPMNVVEPLFHAATGNIPAAGASIMRQAVNPLMRWAAQPSERYNLALGNMLFTPQGAPVLANQLRAGVPPSMRNLLTDWQGQQLLQALRNSQRRSVP